MLELTNNTLVFTFPEVHPQAKLEIAFQRTLRIPDDGSSYPLPPGLGNFPVQHIDDYGDRVPEKWRKRGGVMLPMYQSEALWMSFASAYLPDHGVSYPFALKIAAGKRSAFTGKAWSKSLKEKDYCVVPPQKWLDGFVVEDGTVRQFVAAPLGAGVTAEEQLTGKAEFGGIQIEVLPMRRDRFALKHPKRPTEYWGGRLGILRSVETLGEEDDGYSLCFSDASDGIPAPYGALAYDMGMGAGGKMAQQVFEDPYDLSVWSTGAEYTARCFVHLANSLSWRQITGKEPPTTPFTPAEYKRYNFPWFEYYVDGASSLKSTEKLASLKTVGQMAPHMLPDNTSVTIPKTVKLSPKTKPIRDGKWT